MDELIYAATYPTPDSKTRVLQSERQCGGLTAMALIAASRLGAKCAYAGALGKDELSQFAIEQMEREKIDLRFLRRDSSARPGHSYIVIDSVTGSRTIFSESSPTAGAASNWPAKNVIRNAKVLLVDHKGVPGMIRAATMAREAGIPIVADFERVAGDEFPKLLALADHLILSARFARQLTNEKSPSRMARALWNQSRTVVVITQGEKGCWYLAGDGMDKVQHQPAWNVKAVDTTGCGDVFHGSYAWALTRKMPVDECIRFASAAAALKATRRGGQRSAPTRRAVETFLKSNKPTV